MNKHQSTMWKIIILGLITFLVSCSEETEIGNEIIDSSNFYKEMPVVLSQFSDDSIFVVKIQTTKPAFNKEDIIELPEVANPIIRDLNSGAFYTLEQSSYNEKIYSVKIELTEGTAYKIDIDFPELSEPHVSAVDTIPNISKIKSVEITPETKKADDDLLALVLLEIQPSLLQKMSNYEISVVTTIIDTTDEMGFPIDTAMTKPTTAYLYSDNPAITNEDYYPSVLQFDAFPPTNLYFKKENNSEPFYIDFYYSPPMSSITNMSSGETNTHIYFHSATIYLKTVSENYYKYHVSRLKQFYSREGDPLYGVGEPVNVYTNIENGTGIFASYTCDSVNYSYKSE